MARLAFRMPTIRSVAAAFAITIIAVSVLAALVPALQGLLALFPSLVLTGFVWQLVTYAFVETTPLGVIFGALITWSIGSALEMAWGKKRFVWFALGVSATAAVLTVLLSLVLPNLVRDGYPGGSVLTGSMWVAYGLHIGRGQANFWGAPMSGNMLALIGVGFVFLNAAFSSLAMVIPDAFALLMTFLYMRGARPSELLLRFRSWQLERDLKKRSSHLRGIDGGRNMGNDSDRYLH